MSTPPYRAFPVLEKAQIARLERLGERREIPAGTVLQRPGDLATHVFVVLRGRLSARRPNDDGGEVTIDPGMFTGEASLLSGRRTIAFIEAAEPSEVIALERGEVLELMGADLEVGELLVGEFLRRRVELIERGFSQVVLLGSEHSHDSMRLREFLTRNRQPYRWLDLDRDVDARALLDSLRVPLDDLPVLVGCDSNVLRNPSNGEVAELLGLNEGIDHGHPRDLVVVGAGPAGLAAAVYAASEGLDVLTLETRFPGGQAGSSSRIENYLGFPAGISGLDLADRAYTQARKFGAEIAVAESGMRLRCERRPIAIQTDAAPRIETRAVVIATGAAYRRLGITGTERFEGAGIYYAATPMEAQGCAGDEVIVVGGGNSAGQAAVFLAATVRKVNLLVRGDGLAASMSQYLIHRIGQTKNIELRTHTEIVGLSGDDHVREVTWRDARANADEVRTIGHVFVMAGAVPNTAWLDGCVALDDSGFVLTGNALTDDVLARFGWPLERRPLFLETSTPGVFAVGDVRAGSMKRVASAVGEGSSAVALVHQVLHESA